MASFALNAEFDEWKKVLEAKTMYEESSNTLLVIDNCSKLKGVSELNDRIVYERVVLKCKAGQERPTQSKGHRASSTYKRNCPVEVRLAFNNNKLVVKKVILDHENHSCDKQTYDHYPENVRLNGDDLIAAKEMIEVDGNKKKIKTHLTKQTGKTVLLKTLHNIQTKIRKDKHAGPQNELHKLYNILVQIPNANVCFIDDDYDELVGIFFQDQRMQYLYSKYPELILYNATYKLNNRDMPLFIQCVIDGNGQTEIASLYICKSESRDAIGGMLDVFKKFNPKWSETAVIIGDKDFADRSVYKEKFPLAALQICLYHVLTTFNREVTTQKREISIFQRLAALEILERLVYSQTADAYELCDLRLEHVSKYFDENWYNIKDE